MRKLNNKNDKIQDHGKLEIHPVDFQRICEPRRRYPPDGFLIFQPRSAGGGP